MDREFSAFPHKGHQNGVELVRQDHDLISSPSCGSNPHDDTGHRCRCFRKLGWNGKSIRIGTFVEAAFMTTEMSSVELPSRLSHCQIWSIHHQCTAGDLRGILGCQCYKHTENAVFGWIWMNLAFSIGYKQQTPNNQQKQTEFVGNPS